MNDEMNEIETTEEVVMDQVVEEAIESDGVEEAASAPAVTFSMFGLAPELMQGVNEAGFVEPTPIQVQAIPVALQGKDLLGQALTGTGKTAAFGLPGMQRIMGKPGLQMIVLTPTRELASQISSELFKLGRYTGLKPAAFTGGQSYARQEELLRRGINILVATPGRLIDLMESGHFEGMNPSVIIVDEADEMLDMGFIDDVKQIFEEFPGPHQTMLFSATMPKQVANLAAEILQDPVSLETGFPQAANNEVEQSFFVIQEYERTNAIVRLIESELVAKAIIFCRTREETDSLNILLGGRGYNVNCLHGDMEQNQRSRVMAAFRRGDFDILVATDVAARGLDIDDVSHVFNYHLPFDSRSYVHRIGRTGRAGKSGKAITLVTPHELRSLENIRKAVGAKMSVGTIPSRREVNSQRLQRLLGELFASDLDPVLYNEIMAMIEKEDQDPVVLFTKLITKQLYASADQGPEYIGLSPDKVERLMQERGGRRGGRGGRFGNRGPRRDYDDRPRRREFDDERPPRRRDFDDERPPRRDYDDRPRRRDFDDERPPRRDYDDRPRRRDFDERPPRRDFDDRPRRRDFDERPPRRDFDDRPRRRDFDERPPRRDFDDRPRRRNFDERPPRSERPAAPKPAPVPQYNPDGTPKLNRKQRRLLKFGPPREDGSNA